MLKVNIIPAKGPSTDTPLHHWAWDWNTTNNGTATGDRVNKLHSKRLGCAGSLLSMFYETHENTI